LRRATRQVDAKAVLKAVKALALMIPSGEPSGLNKLTTPVGLACSTPDGWFASGLFKEITIKSEQPNSKITQ
jgi:hypothetical protein